jgi:hypothetical protein
MTTEPLQETTPAVTAEASPSPAVLRHRLWTGTLGVLAAGGLAAAGCVADWSHPGAAGLTAGRLLSWAAILPLAWALRAYFAVAGVAGSPGLRRGAQCLFGAVVLLSVLDVAGIDGLPTGVRIALWVGCGIGLVALTTAPFVGPSDDAEEVPAEKQSKPSRHGLARLIGGLAVAVVVVLKLAAKSIVVKWLVIRWGARWLGHHGIDVEAVGVVVALALTAAFLVWFGVRKLRSADRLGRMAGLVGWFEILLVIGGLALAGWFAGSIYAAARQPGMTDADLETATQGLLQTALLISAAACLVWSTLTAALFTAVRDRLADEECA